MNIRQRSIKTLKKAVKNKTLGCYNDQVLIDEACLYYHAESKTCCAVGALIPKKTLLNNLNEYGNCVKPFNKDKGDLISLQSNGRGRYGMKIAELNELQKLHDGAIQSDNSVHELESYINGLA